MAMNIPLRSDYSYLFSNMTGSAGSAAGTSNFLADYASIKNGSYAKLMRAYYGKPGNVDHLVNKQNSTNSTSKDSTEALARIQQTSDKLKESADALIAGGSKSVFRQKDITTKDENGKETTVKGYDTDAIYKAVKSFADDYNALIKATGDSNTKSIASRSASLITATEANSKLLAKVGITIGEDYSLSIDKEAFQKADMNTVKSLFSGTGSFAYRASAQASLINFAADTEASKANTYNYTGSYGNPYNNGSLFNSFM